MNSTDKKMIELKVLLKTMGVIRFDKEFCDEIGILKQNLYQIENPEKVNRVQHFTPEQIKNACKKFGVDANWIFELTDVPFRKKASTLRSTLTSETVKNQQSKIS